MLTVLYKDKFGNETLWQARSVRRIRQTDGDDEPGLVITLPDGEPMNYTVADVSENPDDPWPEFYVMNEAGATVAKYTMRYTR